MLDLLIEKNCKEWKLKNWQFLNPNTGKIEFLFINGILNQIKSLEIFEELEKLIKYNFDVNLYSYIENKSVNIYLKLLTK